MQGRPFHLLLAIIFLHHVQVYATAPEAAILTQLREVWSTCTLGSWVDSIDPCHGPWLGVECALDNQPLLQAPCFILQSNCSVMSVNLPSCNLTGEIPLILAGLTGLQTLDLRGNSLIGGVTPELLSSFPRLSSLNLSTNYLNGTIPKTQNATLTSNSWARNCFSADTDCQLAPGMRPISECKLLTSVQLPPCNSWTRNHPLLVIVLLVLCPFTFIILLSLLVILYFWRRRSLQASVFWQLKSSVRGPIEEQSQQNICRHFTYQELQAATDNFHHNCLLGGGRSGFVYQGKLDDGTSVAIKQLETHNSGALIDNAFWNEVLIRGTIVHPNVVTLRGYCKGVGGCEPMLVCEYAANGSVLDALHSDDDSLLRWPRRYSIAYGAAVGLEFLHEHCTPPIIHGNIKPSNVLLDRDYNAKVGHFGSVRVAAVANRALVTTLGCVDPEYVVTGKLNEKSDVFSYGMLLLVLVSGRRMLESHPSGKPQLLSWMQLLAKAQLAELVDPRLAGEFDKHEVSLCAQIVLLCTRIQPELRPSMSEVRRILEGTAQVPISGSLHDTPITSSHTSFVSMSQFSGNLFYGNTSE